MVGNLDHRNAAHEDRGEESSHVAHDAAAERDHYARPVAARLHHLFRQRFHFRQALARLASGKDEHMRIQRLLQQRPVQFPHIGCGDHEQLARVRRNKLRDAPQAAPLDDRIVGSLRRFHAKGGHTFVVPWALYDRC